MTSSARQTTMGGADEDWLREIVHALRQPKSDRKKLAKTRSRNMRPNSILQTRHLTSSGKLN